MSNSESSSELETFCVGHPLDYAMRGVGEIPSRERRSNNDLTAPIESNYGTELSEDTASVIKRLHSANDAKALVEAVKITGLDEVEDYSTLLPEFDDEPDLGNVMNTLDTSLHHSLAPRSKEAGKVSSKRHRNTVYIPELVTGAGDGDVYMAKTLSTTAKVRMAWDLDDENQVVVVDEYDKWENLLGWKKLKNLPHGKNKIREELGDQLSDEVLKIVAGSDDNSDDSDSSNDSTGSKGRRTRTKPSDEVLNVARSSSHSSRRKIESQDILEAFEDDDAIGSTYNPVDMLILFPTTTDLNMTDHWWVPGGRWQDVGQAAIANCNKGTFEYLNQCDEVWHIEDYLEQADDYEFETNHGPVTLGTVDWDNLVLHVVDEKMYPRLMNGTAIEHMPEVLPAYCEENMYNSPDFPHADDMLYAPITQEDAFWMRPELRKMQNPSDGDGIILYGSTKPRDMGNSYSMSGDYKLYARARLPDWDFDSTEMSTLDAASYKLDLDNGGFEIIETLAKLHDNGQQPYSETPQARWTP